MIKNEVLYKILSEQYNCHSKPDARSHLIDEALQDGDDTGEQGVQSEHHIIDGHRHQAVRVVQEVQVLRQGHSGGQPPRLWPVRISHATIDIIGA